MAYDYTQNLFVYSGRNGFGRSIGLLGALESGRVWLDWETWRIVRGDTVRTLGDARNLGIEYLLDRTEARVAAWLECDTVHRYRLVTA